MRANVGGKVQIGKPESVTLRVFRKSENTWYDIKDLPQTKRLHRYVGLKLRLQQIAGERWRCTYYFLGLVPVWWCNLNCECRPES